MRPEQHASAQELYKPLLTDSAGCSYPALATLIGVYFMLSACTTISPRRADLPVSATQDPVFSHQTFDRILNTYVDDRGRVDYSALQDRTESLEQYYQLIASYSPDSHPALFPGTDHQLAYWINAYNTAVVKIVVDNYPITSVTDIGPPAPLFFLPDKWGFFIFHRPQFGNVNTSLYYLEKSVIRKRYLEPRIHFALNCASIGCPKLPRYAFTGQRLQQQLEHEARKFFTEQRNLRIDHRSSVVYMSSIMDWYEDDFVAWLKKHHPERRPTLINYVSLYVDDRTSRELAKAGDYKVKFVPYDWGLNDQIRIP